MKVLLVEDDALVRSLQSLIITDYCTSARVAVDVIEAGNGNKAIERLMPDGKLDKSFCAVITDCNMKPGKSGIWLLQFLNESRARLPCLLHSAASEYVESGVTVDLRGIHRVFPFAEFHEKTLDYEYLEEFIKKLL